MALRQTAVLATAGALLVLAALASVALGSTTIPLADVLHALPLVGDGNVDEATDKIIDNLRIPRTVTAIAVGAALGVSGALLQGALANPLASPEVIGVTAGAGFGAMVLLLAIPDAVALVPLSALAVGLLAAGLVFVVAWSGRGGGSIARLILAGIAVSAVFTAGTTMLMTAYPDRVSSAIFFIAGYIADDGWGVLEHVWYYVVAGLALAALLVRPLDRLALGDDVAQSLGVRPRAIRLAAAAVAALLAAAAAALAGLLGFVGLVVPHVMRMAGGTASHRFVVPASALGGAAILLIADIVSRRVAAPLALPVGPFMVALGVPLFLWLLRKAV
ncbi:FecCD family ABC transporter permease [Patulibacter defluvii]|uniref:FecCD family ABC transporter permease n=1 Tax=Patulibacter defluvii TaxID=3095358 RepID=UPI002A75ED5B|nr:iron ABC transporter permease [Patulibacter sp. DM4]